MTDAEKRRRVCWMILVCLAQPEWHPARTTRLPELAYELAVYSDRHRRDRVS